MKGKNVGISKRHRILIASDGSPPSEAALATAVKFPWAASSSARAVVARSEWFRPGSDKANAVLAQTFDAAAENARRTLSLRWKTSDVATRNEPPGIAILLEAERFKASVIVLGWRGHGTFKRLLAGSVARTIAADANCPVLVVRNTPATVRRFVIGFDGCPNAERALEFLCSLEPRSGSHAMLVYAVAPTPLPASGSLLPASLRAHIRREVAALNTENLKKAKEALNVAVARLKRCGWSATGVVRVGAPLKSLLDAAEEARADVLVVGARAVSGVERMLLGSVANGALNLSKVAVLLVR